MFVVYIRQYLAVVWWGMFNSSKCLLCIIFFCLCSPGLPFSIHSGLRCGIKICLPFSSGWLRVSTGAVLFFGPLDRHRDIHGEHAHMCTRTHVYTEYMFPEIHWILLKPLTKTWIQISGPNANEFSGESQIVWSRPVFFVATSLRLVKESSYSLIP